MFVCLGKWSYSGVVKCIVTCKTTPRHRLCALKIKYGLKKVVPPSQMFLIVFRPTEMSNFTHLHLWKQSIPMIVRRVTCVFCFLLWRLQFVQYEPVTHHRQLSWSTWIPRMIGRVFRSHPLVRTPNLTWRCSPVCSPELLPLLSPQIFI